MIICLGPVCIPLHMLLAFLVGLAHNRGYLLWFKKEWVTFRYWKKRWFGSGAKAKGASVPTAVADTKAAKAQ